MNPGEIGWTSMREVWPLFLGQLELKQLHKRGDFEKQVMNTSLKCTESLTTTQDAQSSFTMSFIEHIKIIHLDRCAHMFPRHLDPITHMGIILLCLNSGHLRVASTWSRSALGQRLPLIRAFRWFLSWHRLPLCSAESVTQLHNIWL